MLIRIFVLSIALGSFNIYAASQNTIQLGVYQSDITYTEPDVMQEVGSLTGFIGRYSSHGDNSFRELEVLYATGYMDYEGSGTITDIPDEMFEIRSLIGADMYFGSHYRVTPYIGLGYRNLNDDSSGLVSSTSASGYERNQVYIYLPIGIELQRRNTMSGWALSGRVEYDYFIEGINHSYVGDTEGYEDLTFDQNDGYGYRASIALTKTFDSGWGVTVEPFYRYWHILESEVTYSVRNTSWVEPDNYSKEFGVSLLLSF